MSNNILGLNRDQLAKALGGNYSVIRAFEQLMLDSSLTPTTIEEATAIANTAMSAATQALSMLGEVLSALDPLTSAPASAEHAPEEAYAPAVTNPILGTIAEQDAEAVTITGGTMDGVTIGASQPAQGNFTTLNAEEGFGCNGTDPQESYAVGAAAIDLSTAIALTNKIRLALIANGIAS